MYEFLHRVGQTRSFRRCRLNVRCGPLCRLQLDILSGPRSAKRDKGPVDWHERNTITFRVIHDTPTGTREVAMADAVNNGVNVDALIAARDALTKAPEAAKFKWRAACEWKNSTHSHSTVEGFFGLGEEQRRKRTFKFDADHPEVFASEDVGATPVEYVLVGLASCLTTGIAAVAQHRKIQLRSVTATIEGDMDIQGILGIDGDVRNGFSGIKIKYKIDADAKREDIEALVAQSQKRSAVYDIVTNPTNVTVEVT